MKNFIKKWNYLLITFLGALGVIIAVYILQKVAPFGENSLLTIDFFHQYGPMLAELRDRLLHGLNLVYSFRMGMGLPFFRNFYNYLSSPFNILLLLFKHKDILMSYSVIIGLKAIASALTMAIFLKNKLGKNYAFIALSILYAFNAYFLAYYWNIMWLDGMVMLPLVSYGIELLVNKNKILLYVISLAVAIFSNYFMGYMLCIFSVLYFIICMIIYTKKIKLKTISKKVLTFAGASLIAGGLCAFFLIALYLGLQEISATNDIIPTSQYYAFTIKEFLFNHFTGVGSTVLKSGVSRAPNISVGVLPIGLLFLFIINPKVNIKTKIAYISLLVFLVISFRWALLDFIWHAFHVPNDLPYRYSYIYSFVLIVIGAYSIKNIKDIKPLYVAIVYGLLLGFITLMKVLNFENIYNDMIIVNYIIVTIYFLCYILDTYFKQWNKGALFFLILTSVMESIMVINNNWDINQNIEGFYSDYNYIKEDLDYIQDKDSDFYRVEKLSMLTFNDPSWYGYNGQVTFSSMEYENMAVLQHYLGMPGNEINSYYYKQNTPIYDLMFNIKYLIGTSVDDNRYSLFYQNEHSKVYRFKNNIGLMFGVKNDITNWSNSFNNPFRNQNDFIEKATGVSNVLEKVENVKSEIVYTNNNDTIIKYSVKNFNDNYYIYVPNNGGADFVFAEDTLYYFNDDYEYVNDYSNIQVYNYSYYNENHIINQKTNDKEINVYVGYSFYSDNPISIYRLNIDKFDVAYSYLLDNKVNISEFKDSYIKANSNFNTDTTVYTSIPYDSGWQVYIDGEKVQTFALADTLLTYNVPKGKHLIELKYWIPYNDLGLFITVVSLGGLVIWITLKKEAF